MRTAEELRDRSEKYFDEVRAAIGIRDAYRDIIASNSQSLFPVFNENKVAKAALSRALEYRSNDGAVLFRSLTIQVNAIFEQFVRDLTTVVVQRHVESAQKYTDLDEDFRDSHVMSSGSVLACIKAGTVQGQPFDFVGLKASLGLCLMDQEKYSVNPSVFTIQMGNCTSKRISKLFANLLLPEPFSELLSGSEKLKKALNQPRKANIGKVAGEALDGQLDIRNRIVHGDLGFAVSELDLNNTIVIFDGLIDGLCLVAK